jgi:CheY-like chemotaxis protein
MPNNPEPAHLLVLGPGADVRGLIVDLLQRHGRGARLAVVSKDPGHLVRSLLEREGHQIRVGPSREAMEAVISAEPDLVVIDVEALKTLMDELHITQPSMKMGAELIPICAQCKNVRNQNNKWEPIESYLLGHFVVQFTHTLCPQHLGSSETSPTGAPRKAG